MSTTLGELTHLLLNKISDPQFVLPPTTVLKTMLIERRFSKR